ncbi:metallophosphatase [Chondromyces crocatus]|uniref:Metallophosphatase n=2 Tax=Chondromyces crocatus TaxID=52 RepID=A0A0K1ECT1_CHOCO|nr:metallophosphatase [Chondromyces crocatus]
MQRREFLRSTAVLAGAFLAPGCAAPPEIEVLDGATYFPQSVASGEPRPESVILWTRIQNPRHAGRDVPLHLEVSTSEDFQSLVVSTSVWARARHDYCVKVRIEQLSPATTYHYRFIHDHHGRRYASRPGRTRTAPAPGADVPVRFAFLSGQDFSAGHYNALLLLAREEIDFVVHLGGYIHEVAERGIRVARQVTFTDQEGAMPVEVDGREVLAAASLDNYRELYRVYRSDRALQRVHERFPMVMIWGDHEFSEDSYGATSTYFDERADETDVRRRKRANRAWFEYQPVDTPNEESVYDPDAPYPGQLRIHRDLVFGRHVHLVLTDLRTHRGDHLVPEDALPGAVVITDAALREKEAASYPPAWASRYVDVETYQGGIYQSALIAAAPTCGYDPVLVHGDLAVDFINEVLSVHNATLPVTKRLAPIDATASPLWGVSFGDIGKVAPYSAMGARYLLRKEAFDSYARQRYEQSRGRSEQIMGSEQELWFLKTLQTSEATWKVWASEHAFSPQVLDLTHANVPAPLQRAFYVSGDTWDGFPNRRRALLEALARLDGMVVLSGDAGAFFAALPAVEGDEGRRVVEFAGPPVSSRPLDGRLAKQVGEHPLLKGQVSSNQAGAMATETLLTAPEVGANPHLALAKTQRNGYVVVEAGPDALHTTARLLDPEDLDADHTGLELGLAARLETIRLRILAGEAALEREEELVWRRWSPELAMWV